MSMKTSPRKKKQATKEPFVVPELLTVEDAAAILRMSKMTVYRLVDSGDLPHFRIGRTVRIRKDDFEHYLRRAYSA